MLYLQKVAPLFSPLFFGAAIIAAASIGGCSAASDKSAPEAAVVAVVNGKNIRADRFFKEYNSIKKRFRIADTQNDNLERRLREEVLDSLINHVLLSEEAEKALIEIPAEMWEQESRKLIQDFSPARLRLTLERGGTTLEKWKEGVYRNLLMEKFINTKIAPLVEVPEEEIKKYYRDHPEEFKVPTRVHAYHIVVSTLSEADEIRNELLYGVDFSELAIKYSKGPEAESGGDLGIFAKRQMPKEFDDVIFILKINEIGKVVESPYGYHIFKVIEKFDPRSMKYTEAKEKIKKRMFNEKLEEKFSEWFREIKEKARVTVYFEKLQEL